MDKRTHSHGKLDARCKGSFNSPSHRYQAPEQRVPEQDEFDDASLYSRSSMGSGGAGSNNGSASLLEYNTVNEYSLNDHWSSAPTPTNVHGAFYHSLTPPRLIALDDAYKQVGDPAIEAKLREKLAESQHQQHTAAVTALTEDSRDIDILEIGNLVPYKFRTPRGYFTVSLDVRADSGTQSEHPLVQTV